MSLASYSDLEMAVATWLARPGDTNVTSNVPDWITLLESRLAYGSGDSADPDNTLYTKPLRIRAMEKERTIPIRAVIPAGTVGGTANAITLTPSAPIGSYSLGQTWSFTAAAINTSSVTVNISGLGNRNLLQGSALSALSAGDIVIGQTVQMYDDGTELVYMPGTANAPLPANYLAMRALYVDGQPRTDLSYETPAQANLSFNSLATGLPRRYTIEGDTLRTNPPPDSSYNLVCLYYQKFGALSSATNWLMTNAPNVYLFGTLLEGAVALGMDDGAVQKFLRLFRAACNGIQTHDATDRHSGGLLTIKNDSGNP